MLQSAEVWNRRTTGEVKAQERLDAFMGAQYVNEWDMDEFAQLYDTLQQEIGPDKKHLRAMDEARSMFSDEVKGPWCDELLRWHGHGKNDTASRWYKVCKLCCPSRSDG